MNGKIPVYNTLNTRSHWYHRLSVKLMIWVLLSSLGVGLVLSCIQISVEAVTAQRHLDNDIRQYLSTVRHSASQAIYSIDPVLGDQVLEGLLTSEAIIEARITHPNGKVLSEKSRPLDTSPSRLLTDKLFGRVRPYSLGLYMDTPEPTHYGNLEVVVDTYYAASRFLQRTLITFISGLTMALILAIVLYMAYHVILTAPIKQIIDSLLRIDPAEPGLQSVPIPPQHERDELGTLVRSTNELLNAIEGHQNRRAEAEARVLRLSQFDVLTGLPNRTQFRSYLQGAIDEAQINDQRLAVICIGIDDFSSINEQYGYNIGDRLLQRFAERLNDSRDSLHTSCRLVGDLFAMIQFNVISTLRVAAFAEDLLKDLSRPFEIEDQTIQITASMGIVLYPEDGTKPEKLLQQAEQTMALAKNDSGNRFHFYVASVDAEIRERKQLEKDLIKAWKEQQLALAYQPKVDMVSGTVVGVEALLRWTHPEKGFIPPDVFIPIAESNDSIVDIGYWVIRQACKDHQKLRAMGFTVPVAINLSARQLHQPDFVSQTLRILEEEKTVYESLSFEITETAFMSDLDQAISTLQALSTQNLGCAVDDFGTGFSSLSYLKQLPVNTLKIDKQFIRDLLEDEDDRQIVHAIIQLGRSLNLEVIAEGVETLDQARLLVRDKCHIGQGYYFSRPVPLASLEEALKDATQKAQSVLREENNA